VIGVADGSFRAGKRVIRDSMLCIECWVRLRGIERWRGLKERWFSGLGLLNCPVWDGSDLSANDDARASIFGTKGFTVCDV